MTDLDFTKTDIGFFLIDPDLLVTDLNHGIIDTDFFVIDINPGGIDLETGVFNLDPHIIDLWNENSKRQSGSQSRCYTKGRTDRMRGNGRKTKIVNRL